MTATQAPVMPLKPVRSGRPPARVPAAEAPSATPEETGVHVETPSPDAERVAATTRSVFRGVLIGFRISGIVALAMVVYFAWTQNWVGSTADALVTWYSTTVAPYLEVDFVGPAVPTIQDGLVGPINEDSLVVTN